MGAVIMDGRHRKHGRAIMQKERSPERLFGIEKCL